MFYKFNKNAKTDSPKGLRAYKVYQHFSNGGKFSDLDNVDKGLFSELWHYETYCHGVIRQMGWLFDFREFFKKYLVKLKYYGWREVYAPNKTAIKYNAVVPSRILRIVEID